MSPQQTTLFTEIRSNNWTCSSWLTKQTSHLPQESHLCLLRAGMTNGPSHLAFKYILCLLKAWETPYLIIFNTLSSLPTTWEFALFPFATPLTQFGLCIRGLGHPLEHSQPSGDHILKENLRFPGSHHLSTASQWRMGTFIIGPSMCTAGTWSDFFFVPSACV